MIDEQIDNVVYKVVVNHEERYSIWPQTRGVDMSLVTTESRFFGKDYITALKKYYPNLVEGASRFTVDDLLHVGIVTEWMAYFNEVGVEGQIAFSPLLIVLGAPICLPGPFLEAGATGGMLVRMVPIKA